MDLQFLQTPALLWFMFAFCVELFVTGRAFLNEDAIVAKGMMRTLGVLVLGFMSAWNIYAAIEVYNNDALNAALITKLGFSLGGLCLQVWVLVFLLGKR